MPVCAPLALPGDRYVDLSMKWSGDTPPFPTDPAPVVRWIKRLASHGTNHQLIETPLHVGTHIDAPLHWSDAGGDVASMPLDRLAGPAVVADLSEQLEDFSLIDPRAVEAAAPISDGDIVIVHTGYHRFAADATGADGVRYFWKHPGAVRDLAEWALDRKLRWIGFDMASPDHPLNSNLRRQIPDHVVQEGEARLGATVASAFPPEGFQVMHVVLCGAGVPIVENIGGSIDAFLGRRFRAFAFPWRFVGGEAALVRVVAEPGGA
jgi:arylformamidase